MSNKQVSFYYDSEKWEKFCKKFPRLRTTFLSACLDLAITDQNFVRSVVFGSVKVNS